MEAILDVRVVGFLAVIQTPEPHVMRVIDLIGVDPNAQGRGVGRALVETFVREAYGRAARVEVGTQAANASSISRYCTTADAPDANARQIVEVARSTSITATALPSNCRPCTSPGEQ